MWTTNKKYGITAAGPSGFTGFPDARLRTLRPPGCGGSDDALTQPIFNLALVPDQDTTVIALPAFRRLAGKLVVPFGDFGVAGRA
jgi:hypothetical protein